MKWFGPSWGAPFCQEKDHVGTPSGLKCTRCEVVIKPTDQGFLVPAYGVANLYVAYHLDCLLVEVGVKKGE
jgi:hypothetical protein